jgi:hypothetical protein
MLLDGLQAGTEKRRNPASSIGQRVRPRGSPIESKAAADVVPQSSGLPHAGAQESRIRCYGDFREVQGISTSGFVAGSTGVMVTELLPVPRAALAELQKCR